MTTETERDLALRVIELLDLRDKLLEQNKSYINLVREVREEKPNVLEDQDYDIIEKVVRKHKTVANVLSLLQRSKIMHDEANQLLISALRDGRQFTEAGALKELRRTR